VGGTAFALDCGSADPFPTNNVYVRSTRPLGAKELKSILASELAQVEVSGATLEREVRAELRARKHGHRRQTLMKTPPLPRGVLSVSDGCPSSSEAAGATPLALLSGALPPVLAAKRPAP
jgi:hypothetical protein